MTDTPGPGGSIFRYVLGLLGFVIGMIGVVYVFRRNLLVGGALLLAATVLEALAFQPKGGPRGRNHP